MNNGAVFDEMAEAFTAKPVTAALPEFWTTKLTWTT